MHFVRCVAAFKSIGSINLFFIIIEVETLATAWSVSTKQQFWTIQWHADQTGVHLLRNVEYYAALPILFVGIVAFMFSFILGQTITTFSLHEHFGRAAWPTLLSIVASILPVDPCIRSFSFCNSRPQMYQVCKMWLRVCHRAIAAFWAPFCLFASTPEWNERTKVYFAVCYRLEQQAEKTAVMAISKWNAVVLFRLNKVIKNSEQTAERHTLPRFLSQ